MEYQNETQIVTNPSVSTFKTPLGRGEDEYQYQYRYQLRETPPRAWGRLEMRVNLTPALRNTPTGVGKTGSSVWEGAKRWKHPHGRGED